MATRVHTVTRVSPLTVFRTAFTLSLVGLAAWVLCVTLLYFGMDAAGVWDKVNDVIGGVGGSQTITFGLVLSLASLLGALMTLAASILAPLIAVVYNASVDLFGGVKVTLREEF
ncbi:DUF3566 domain-containing protein [Corynebacterium felinum]|uniref:Membrane protein n=1 Tax=Corynebacterium felinum TaxID=131318 RepID=A0ABU2B6Q5_9CORY|nr:MULTISPECIES: DUF3566 domain-containing protein [Corynebacterium]MDF5819575.1 DUF3566 domain-containing protein [Corynebacterium felinum]MDO4762650.1 DUF3566 domain-containing protein [Corynebacterium sp.]MDR7354297.1 putative membrane protein [Corynebacterium felinum]WJY93674.1 hypothetical protein CFELI_00050 [Corynebacterium felinum]